MRPAPTATIDHPSYAAPAGWRDGVFHLPEPDHEPVPRPARCALVWRGPRWVEIDPATGHVVGRGRVAEGEGTCG